MNITSKLSEWRLFIAWALAYGIGWIVASFVISWVMWLYFPFVFSAKDVLINDSVAGAILGVCIGLPTALVIRSRVGKFGLWLLSMIVACAFGIFVGDALNRLLTIDGQMTSLMTGVTIGLSIGIAQWLILKHRVHRAGWWLLVNTLCWAISSFVLSGDSALLVGPVVGITTGLFLTILFKQSGAQATSYATI